MPTTKIFKTDDLVFAKVKGFSPWPAQVGLVKDGRRISVNFFGTNEIAVLSAAAMEPYSEALHKKYEIKFGRRKMYATALCAISDAWKQLSKRPLAGSSVTMTTSPPEVLNTSADSEESQDLDTSMASGLSFDDSESHPEVDSSIASNLNSTNSSEAELPESSKEVVANAVKEELLEYGLSPMDEEADELKTEMDTTNESCDISGVDSRANLSPDDNSSAKIKSETSPSDVKVAVKPLLKISFTQNNVMKLTSTRVHSLYISRELKELMMKMEQSSDPAPKLKEACLLCTTPTDQLLAINIDFKRPDFFSSPDEQLQWELNAAKNALQLMNDIEDGKTSIEDLKDGVVVVLNEFEQLLAIIREHIVNRVLSEKILNFLKIENEYLHYIREIRTALSLTAADLDKAIGIMNSICCWDITRITLLKHPVIIDTIYNLTRYVGNLGQWKRTGIIEDTVDIQDLNSKISTIKSLSRSSFNKLVNVMGAASEKEFWTKLDVLHKEFIRACRNKNMSLKEVITITNQEYDVFIKNFRARKGGPTNMGSPAKG